MIEVVRARRQSIIIGDDIEITVLSTSGDSVRIGIQAPREVPVFRKEIYVEIVARAEGLVRAEDAGALMPSRRQQRQ